MRAVRRSEADLLRSEALVAKLSQNQQRVAQLSEQLSSQLGPVSAA